MKKKLLAITLAMTAVLSLAACGSNTTTPSTGKPSAVAEDSGKNKDGKDDIHKREAQEDIPEVREDVEPIDGYVSRTESEIVSYLGRGDNFCYSPESLKTALQLYSKMIPDGEEKEQIAEFCGDRDYLKYYNTDVLKFCNRIWANSNRKFNWKAADGDISDYVFDIDMSKPDATEIKNQYVKDETDGFLEGTPTIFNDSVITDVMNITYFKDIWADTNTFDITDYQGTFANADGTKTDVEMVGFDDEYAGYYETKQAYALYLDYENGDNMIIILPKDHVTDMSAIDINAFYPDNVENISYKTPDRLIFRVPRIDLTNNWTIEATDQATKNALGIPAFGTSGLIPELYKGDDYSTMLNQIVRIKSDEEGTEAAAVTEIITKDNCAMPVEEPEIFEFICDRPFLYVVYDKANDDVAFVGQYMNVK
jgi:serpin B